MQTQIEGYEAMIIRWAKVVGYEVVKKGTPHWREWLEFRDRHKMVSDFWKEQSRVTVPRVKEVPSTFPTSLGGGSIRDNLA